MTLRPTEWPWVDLYLDDSFKERHGQVADESILPWATTKEVVLASTNPNKGNDKCMIIGKIY